jgi:hypothetical protein
LLGDKIHQVILGKNSGFYTLVLADHIHWAVWLLLQLLIGLFSHAGGARIAFVHPKATGGLLLELSQRI